MRSRALASLALTLGCASPPPPIPPPEPASVAFRGVVSANPPRAERAPAPPACTIAPCDPPNVALAASRPITKEDVLASHPGNGWHCYRANEASICRRSLSACQQLLAAVAGSGLSFKLKPCVAVDTAYCYAVALQHPASPQHGAFARFYCGAERSRCDHMARVHRELGEPASECIEVP